MIKALAVAATIFLLLLASIMLYRFFFDRKRWDRALADAREASARSRAKSRLRAEERARIVSKACRAKRPKRNVIQSKLTDREWRLRRLAQKKRDRKK